MNEVQKIEVGSCINYRGDMANPGATGAIVSITPNSWSINYEIILTDGRTLRVTSFNSRLVVLDSMASPEEIATLYAARAIFKARASSKAALAKLAYEQQCEALKAANPELEVGTSPVVAARNLRKLLNAAFPGTKFSVRTSSFSMGNSIDVTWAGGPSQAEVDAIADQFQYGRFDGMSDSYEYSRSAWTEIFGGTKYVSTYRQA